MRFKKKVGVMSRARAAVQPGARAPPAHLTSRRRALTFAASTDCIEGAGADAALLDSTRRRLPGGGIR